MKVLLINGSPHAKGSTYTALHEMEQVFAGEGMETEILHIGNQDIRGCVACGFCGGHGRCAFNDVVNEAGSRKPGLLCVRQCHIGCVSGSSVLQHAL